MTRTITPCHDDGTPLPPNELLKRKQQTERKAHEQAVEILKVAAKLELLRRDRDATVRSYLSQELGTQAEIAVAAMLDRTTVNKLVNREAK